MQEDVRMRKALGLRVAAISVAGLTAVGLVAGCSNGSSGSGSATSTSTACARPTGFPGGARPTARPTGFPGGVRPTGAGRPGGCGFGHFGGGTPTAASTTAPAA